MFQVACHPGRQHGWSRTSRFEANDDERRKLHCHTSRILLPGFLGAGDDLFPVRPQPSWSTGDPRSSQRLADGRTRTSPQATCAPVLSCHSTLDALGYRLRRTGAEVRPRAFPAGSEKAGQGTARGRLSELDPGSRAFPGVIGWSGSLLTAGRQYGHSSPANHAGWPADGEKRPVPAASAYTLYDQRSNFHPPSSGGRVSGHGSRHSCPRCRGTN